MPRRDFSKVAFAATGDTNSIPTPTQPDGSVSLQQGFTFDYQRDNGAGGGTPDPLAKNIDREDMNGILNEITASVGEIQQNGYAIWVSTAAPYPINARVRDSDKVWQSQVTNNNSTPGANADWLDVTSVAPLFLLADATSGSLTLTLPLANAATGPVERIYRRTDITTNAVVIQASGTDRIMLDTSASTSGATQTELIFGGDYLRLRSDGAGKWWCVGQAQLPASIGTGSTRYTAAGVSTFTVPAVLRSGRRRARVAVVGGGGGGGGTASSTAAASGGGGGGATGVKLVDLSGVSSVAVTIATGGAGGSGAVNGSAGGTSSFGSYVSASGGSGGPTSTGVSTFSGAGGVSTTGADAAFSGGAGRYSLVAGGGGLAAAGVGGDSFFSKGSAAPNLSGTAVAALPGAVGLLGAGGSGAASYNASSVGGNGGAGYCEINWG